MTSHEELELRIMGYEGKSPVEGGKSPVEGGKSSVEEGESTNLDNNPLSEGRTIEQINTTLLGISYKSGEEICDILQDNDDTKTIE